MADALPVEGLGTRGGVAAAASRLPTPTGRSRSEWRR
jgi:hypothetical protein